MTARQTARLVPALSGLLAFSKPDRAEAVADDPVSFPRRYPHPQDAEVVGWIAASLAYGRVASFQGVIARILALSEGAPYDYFLNFNPKKARAHFEKLAYRFQTPQDLFVFACLIHRVLQEYGRIGTSVLACYRREETDIGPTLSRWVSKLRDQVKDEMTPGLCHLLPSPDAGSACKRLNLYLRWMVRARDGIDLGLWSEISPSQLIIPLDTHIIRISRYLGLTRRATPDWKMAQGITRSLLKFDASDPLKYDFVLCHLGISGACPISARFERCAACALRPACRRGRRITRGATCPEREGLGPGDCSGFAL